LFIFLYSQTVFTIWMSLVTNTLMPNITGW